MKRILLAAALLLPMVSYAESATDMMQELLDKKDRWDKLDYAKIGIRQAGAECKADIGKQGVEIDPEWQNAANQEIADIKYKLSVAMAQMEHVKMFKACMEAKGWKFRPYTKAEQEQRKQEQEKQNEGQ